MPFNRAMAPAATPKPDELTSAMVGIGMSFAARAAPDPNLEDTLLFASREAVEKDDLRVLAVLVTWFGVHASWVNADRLTKLVAGNASHACERSGQLSLAGNQRTAASHAWRRSIQEPGSTSSPQARTSRSNATVRMSVSWAVP
jgi:hypothetical protein